MSSPQQPLSQAQSSHLLPRELEGLAVPQPRSTIETMSGTKESSSPSVAGDPGHFSFLSLVHSYLWSAVTLADQKAGFLFASSSAFLGYLMSDGILRQMRSPSSLWLQWSAVASLILLLTSIGLAINVVMPRLGGSKEGLIYFRAIACRKMREHYVFDLLSSTQGSLNTALAQHSYELSKICTRKYQYLRIGIWVGLSGFVAGLIFIGLTR